ncbi:hypothetical protein J437_LFUL006952 [Ladona fulva]|uniref:Reverse transcriptase domain-containing protein n=1 Tax=Ladona fulva TaxID=123851 RepID=A0A8K0KBV6_LADFU|nr:hypothetical protein J437_LFUL006952 [Ladona fulva]
MEQLKSIWKATWSQFKAVACQACQNKTSLDSKPPRIQAENPVWYLHTIVRQQKGSKRRDPPWKWPHLLENGPSKKKSFLVGHTFSVIWGTGVSPPRPIYAGVPQGSVLGPLLFNLFMHNIPRDSGRHVEIGLYTDDFAMFASSINKERAIQYLQRAVDEMVSYYKKWRMNLNPEKIKALLFQPYKQVEPRLHLELDDHLNSPKEETDGVQVLRQAYSSIWRTPVELACHIKSEDHRSAAEQGAVELPGDSTIFLHTQCLHPSRDQNRGAGGVLKEKSKEEEKKRLTITMTYIQ